MAILVFAKVCNRCVFSFIHSFIRFNNQKIAYLSEVCDETNEAKAFAWFGMLGGIGSLVGPSMGGWLAQPAAKVFIIVDC